MTTDCQSGEITEVMSGVCMNSTELILTIVTLVGGSITLGVSGAFAWFKKSKDRIYERLEDLEKEMNAYAGKQQDWHLQNSSKLAVLENNQKHIDNSLARIEGMTRGTNSQFQKLLEILMKQVPTGDNGHER
jgi:hypothetical protein